MAGPGACQQFLNLSGRQPPVMVLARLLYLLAALCKEIASCSGDLASLRTTRIVPADLNAFLYQMEANMERFATVRLYCRLHQPGSTWHASRNTGEGMPLRSWQGLTSH